MKVLLAHNFYGSGAPSGENEVFKSESRLLQRNKYELSEFCRYSDEIRAEGLRGTMKGALSTPWNPFSAHKIQREIETFRPDVVHVHNTFPLLSPAIFHAIGGRAARVLTLHNYRVFCPAGVPMRDGNICTKCLDRRSALPSLLYGCYRNSRIATLPLASSVSLHRFLGTWSKQVDAFIALTSFQREVMVEAGLPRDLVHVKPNFFPGNPTVTPWSERKDCAVFVGRLSEEKGILSLVKAWLMWGSTAPELRVIGDGPLRPELDRLVREAPDVSIKILGQLSSNAAQNEIAKSRLLLVPSECFEGFPMVVREAFAFGTPVAASDIGPLPTIVKSGENGFLFQPKNSVSLWNKVRSDWNGENRLERLGHGARRSFEKLYTEKTNLEKLEAIYERAINVNKNRRDK